MCLLGILPPPLKILTLPSPPPPPPQYSKPSYAYDFTVTISQTLSAKSSKTLLKTIDLIVSQARRRCQTQMVLLNMQYKL